MSGAQMDDPDYRRRWIEGMARAVERQLDDLADSEAS
jgi:hypothetical protein